MIQKHDLRILKGDLGWLRKDIGSHGNELALLAHPFALSFGATHPGKAGLTESRVNVLMTCSRLMVPLAWGC